MLREHLDHPHHTHLHDLVLELGQKVVDNLVLLDRERVQENLLHALDLAGLDEPAKLGDGLPFLVVGLGCASAATGTTTATSSSTATGAASESTAPRCCVSHCVIVCVLCLVEVGVVGEPESGNWARLDEGCRRHCRRGGKSIFWVVVFGGPLN